MITKVVQLTSDMQLVKEFNLALNEMNCDVDLVQGRYVIDGKSIMGMFSLNLLEPITLKAHTDDETELEQISKYLA